ncbi:two-component system CitB family sensor kinase [Chromohalobacter marismortui]|uniref:histidine kinase n=1 Tax=Chromohalobacter marismortui TaxID=42055 RepID=A0A4R7NSM7_9GAMM|nr:MULTISPECIES: DcuS/MalK family sensor histidine kinase [Chromohalobacter]MCI0509180.1 DcuS/MalK family sensor histidine kinase [Chromohalobacter sp.]MCI0593871.1 DcuS/MalK family sensor histidine kinase [Chromohalobacter sp.]TDU23927.1 two-component system CitB family sensor kinase [Chromohalobacter marismortui]
MLRLPTVRLNVWISLLVAATVIVTLGVALWLFDATLRDTQAKAQAARVTDIAQVVASRRRVVNALQAKGDKRDYSTDSSLQREIDALRRRLGVDFIVVMNRRAIRLTHPDPARIGEHFRGGDEGPALQGEHYASRAEGTLGTSIRGFAPVRDASGEVIGAVSVGVTLDTLGARLADNRLRVVLGIALLMVLGTLGASWLARYIKRVLMGLEPHQITRLVEERQAILGSVHEGILAVDVAGRITLANTAAHALLDQAGLNTPTLGTSITEYLPQSRLPEVLQHGESALDQEVFINGQALLANRMPIRHHGQVIGAVATFRDKSEVRLLAEELTGVRRYAEALRAATHEFKNKLHVMLGLVQLEEYVALRRYLREVADHHVAPGAALVEGIGEPVLAGFLLGKQSEARERDITLTVDVEDAIPAPCDPAMIHTLVIVLGNLLENAFDAVDEQHERHVTLAMGVDADLLSLHVQDTGPGIPDAMREHVFASGTSSKGNQRGLGLAMVHEHVNAHDGTLALYSEPGRGTLIEVALPYPASSTTEK